METPIFILTMPPMRNYTIENLTPEARKRVILATPENGIGSNKSIPQARQNILNYARKNGIRKYWVLDDDVRFLFAEDDFKYTRRLFNCDIDFPDDTALGGLATSAFARLGLKSGTYWNHGAIFVCWFINEELMGNFNFPDGRYFEDLFASFWAVNSYGKNCIKKTPHIAFSQGLRTSTFSNKEETSMEGYLKHNLYENTYNLMKELDLSIEARKMFNRCSRRWTKIKDKKGNLLGIPKYELNLKD